MTGDGQANVLTGGDGPDTLLGGDGDDTLEGGNGDDALDGGGGVNTVSYANAGSGVTVMLVAGPQNTGGAGTDQLSGIENLIGSGHADTLTGNQVANVLIGGADNDTLNGGGGNDTLEGDGGSNTFRFGPGLGKDTITDFKLGQDIVEIDHTVFSQASKLVAAISDDGGHALLTINTNNTIAFLGVTRDELKAHVADIHIV